MGRQRHLCAFAFGTRDRGKQAHFAQRLPGVLARGEPVYQASGRTRQRPLPRTDARQRDRVAQRQLHFVEPAAQAQAPIAVDVAQQGFDARLVADDAEREVATAPALAGVAAGVRGWTGYWIHQQRPLFVLVRAAIVDGAPHHAFESLQTAGRRREQADQPVRQQGGAGADRRRAAGAAGHQHVAEMARHARGEAAQQRRTGIEQGHPVETRDALGVIVVEAAGAHQPERVAAVGAFDVAAPVDSIQHRVGQRFRVATVRRTLARQRIAQRAEVFHQSRRLPFPFQVAVQRRRFEVPVDHQHRCLRRIRRQPARHRGQQAVAGRAALVGIEGGDRTRAVRQCGDEAILVHVAPHFFGKVRLGAARHSGGTSGSTNWLQSWPGGVCFFW